MPARSGSGNVTYVPGKGSYNRAKKTYSGKGGAPAGYKEVPVPTAATAPTTTVSSSGEITTSGYSSKRAAKVARKRARAAQREVRRVQQALAPVPRKRALKPAPPKAKPVSYEPPKPLRPRPASKPKKFAGKPTAGEPTRRELSKAKKAKTLRVNRKGYVTTPRVRKTAGTIKRISKRAQKRRSRADLPHLEGEGERNARTVLRRGERAKATRKEKLAAIETGLVESGGFVNYTDQAQTDLDSLGWRQERTSIYGSGPKGPTNVKASADRFFREVRTDPGTDSAPTPGLLAQAAQGSAFPERYDQREPEAEAILSAYNRGKLRPAERKKLAKAKKTARKLGLKAGEPSDGTVPRKVLTRFKAAKQAAKELEKADLPYVWGGGHGDPESRPTGGGLDCSGAVSYVLNKMGALKGSLVSGEMGSVLKPGPGAVTVFYNPTHTFMRIGNRYFGTSRTNEGGGAGFIEGKPDDLSKYSVGHVPGLGKKVAVALGVPLTGGGSFPGMSLSESGTAATLTGGGATVDKPGFSSKPIRLTPTQRARRKLRRLDALTVEVDERESTQARSRSTLAQLERKYGVAA